MQAWSGNLTARGVFMFFGREKTENGLLLRQRMKVRACIPVGRRVPVERPSPDVLNVVNTLTIRSIGPQRP